MSLPQKSDIKNILLNKYSFLKERFSSDHCAFNLPQEHLVEFVKDLKENYGYTMCMDVTVVDWDDESPRFTAIYHLYNIDDHMYLRLACDCINDGNPTVPSISHIHSGANWHEREAYDMFGVHFKGHPDLKRILMWDSYSFYPLRKDFPLAGIETSFPAADVAEETNAKVIAAPMMGGPFHASPEARHMSKREPRAADQSWCESNEKPQ